MRNEPALVGRVFTAEIKQATIVEFYAALIFYKLNDNTAEILRIHKPILIIHAEHREAIQRIAVLQVFLKNHDEVLENLSSYFKGHDGKMMERLASK